jgi:hypothetical protein
MQPSSNVRIEEQILLQEKRHANTILGGLFSLKWREKCACADWVEFAARLRTLVNQADYRQRLKRDFHVCPEIMDKINILFGTSSLSRTYWQETHFSRGSSTKDKKYIAERRLEYLNKNAQLPPKCVNFRQWNVEVQIEFYDMD